MEEHQGMTPSPIKAESRREYAASSSRWMTTHGAAVHDVEEAPSPDENRTVVFYADGDRRYAGRALRLHRTPECVVLAVRSARDRQRRGGALAQRFPLVILRAWWITLDFGSHASAHWCTRCAEVPSPLCSPNQIRTTEADDRAEDASTAASMEFMLSARQRSVFADER